EGKGTESFLKKFVPNAEVLHADQKDGSDYLKAQDGCDLVIKTPGIPSALVTKPYTTATNIFFSNVRALVSNPTIIGVTGSKGKSTTVSLISQTLTVGGLTVRLAGNIGVPMLSLLESNQPESTVFVLELSSYMLEDLRQAPDIALFLNFFPEHLDYHHTLESYFGAKAGMTLRQTDNDIFVYPENDLFIAPLATRTKARPIPIVDALPFETKDLPLKGEHNLLNMRATYTVVRQLGVSKEKAKEAFEHFTPLPHRMQYIGEYKHIAFYDDAIATAPEPTAYAIKTIAHVETIFLGGTDRGLTYEKLAQAVCESQIKHIVLFPDTGKKIMDAIRVTCNRRFDILETTSMKEAVEYAYRHTSPGTSCLLSCAAPSYTLWKDFEEKGDVFQKFVEELGKSVTS
ncbi:MAG TPA: UDP-N-acetylmuramoyl-L-alanine--D-glutamate ligase, partial [Patescibacteria group bacterium]|nr:UDP-N-acetylmuramoyl-L-alanine--D-glutamate ligase [Patescibacteria group bacterium]